MRRWTVAVVAFAVLAAAAPIGAWAVRAAGAAPRDGWTALYFEQPQLAEGGLVPDVAQDVGIVVENHGATQRYHWSAAVTAGGASTPLAGDEFTLGAGDHARITIPLPAAHAVDGGRFVVQLDTGQRIDLRIGKVPA